MKLLVIDIQKGITDSRLFNFEAFIDDTIRIIKAARDNQIEVIYFQHDDGPGTGFSIGDEDFEIAEQVIPKEGANSTFDNDYMTGEETYKYYNDMMWPKRFATCVSVDEAIKLMESSIGVCYSFWR